MGSASARSSTAQHTGDARRRQLPRLRRARAAGADARCRSRPNESMWPVLGGVKWAPDLPRRWSRRRSRPRDLCVGHVALDRAPRVLIACGLPGRRGAARRGAVAVGPCSPSRPPCCARLAFARCRSPRSRSRRETTPPFPLIMRFVVLPLFLFSGTFFPISQLPAGCGSSPALSPLWHGVELCRGRATRHDLGVAAVLATSPYLPCGSSPARSLALPHLPRRLPRDDAPTSADLAAADRIAAGHPRAAPAATAGRAQRHACTGAAGADRVGLLRAAASTCCRSASASASSSATSASAGTRCRTRVRRARRCSPSSAMNGAVSTRPSTSSSSCKYAQTYDAVLATPLGVARRGARRDHLGAAARAASTPRLPRRHVGDGPGRRRRGRSSPFPACGADRLRLRRRRAGGDDLHARLASTSTTSTSPSCRCSSSRPRSTRCRPTRRRCGGSCSSRRSTTASRCVRLANAGVWEWAALWHIAFLVVMVVVGILTAKRLTGLLLS